MLGKEGPELPPSRPLLATTHPQLARQGEEVIKEILDISEEGDKEIGGDYSFWCDSLASF